MPKISLLPTGSTPAGTELVPAVQSGQTVHLTAAQIAGTASFDALAPTTTRGDIIFRNATTNARLAAGTSGYALTAAGAGADPAWSGFVQAGTGASTRTWQAKARDRVSVKDFGAVGDGSTNDTAAIQAALDAISALGNGALYFPSGDYKAVGLTWSGAGRLSIYGDGPSSFLQISGTTGILFTATAGYIDIEKLTVYHPTQNLSTDGFFFKFSNATATIRNVQCFNGWNFARWEAGCSQGGAVNIVGRGIKNDFIHVDVSASTGGAQSGNMLFDRLNVQVDSNNIGTGLRLVSGDGLNIANSVIAGFYYGVLAQPLSTRSYLANLYFSNVAVDGAGGPASQGAGWWFDGADQALLRIFLVNCWAGSITDGGVGAKLNDVKTFSWVSGEIIDNGGTGILIDTGCRDISLSNLVVTGNSASSPGNAHGITIASGADRVRVKDCVSGATYNGTLAATQTNSQGYGIAVANSGTTNYQIIGNDVSSNLTAGILDSGGAGGNRIVKDNPGYNPIGSATFVLGASPATHTALAVPETVYIAGGTVSSITVGGVQVAAAVSGIPAVIALNPNQAMVVTYTVAPTITVANKQ